MRDREIVCEYYTYAGGPCSKRKTKVWFRKTCQKCKQYRALKGGKPARLNLKKKRKERNLKKIGGIGYNDYFF